VKFVVNFHEKHTSQGQFAVRTSLAASAMVYLL